MRRRSVLPATLLAVAAVVAGPAVARDAAAPVCAAADVRTTVQTLEETTSALRCLLQAERAARDLPAFRPSGPLRTAARRHAADMARHGYFGHVSRDGRTVCDRVRATGYLRGSKRRYHLGETLVYGINGDSTPARLAANLLASAAHRRLLLRAELRDLGVGLVPGLPLAGDRRPGATVVIDLGRRVTNRSGSFKGAKTCATRSSRTTSP